MKDREVYAYFFEMMHKKKIKELETKVCKNIHSELIKYNNGYFINSIISIVDNAANSVIEHRSQKNMISKFFNKKEKSAINSMQQLSKLLAEQDNMQGILECFSNYFMNTQEMMELCEQLILLLNDHLKSIDDCNSVTFQDGNKIKINMDGDEVTMGSTRFWLMLANSDNALNFSQALTLCKS